MRILNLIQCANLGGMEQASLRLMRGLKARGHHVEMLSLNPVGELGPLLEEAGIPCQGFPYLGKGGWRSHLLIRRKLAESRADAMLMTGHNLLAMLALGKFCEGRRVLTLHFHHAGVKPRWQWRLIYHAARRRFTAMTFPCDFIRREAESISPAIRPFSNTVRYPLEVPSLPDAMERMAARKDISFPLDRPVVGNGGWLIPRKRFDVFLHVAKEVLNANPAVIFAIAGDGPERTALEALANQLGISQSVRWLGWQRDMGRFYKTLDVVLFNSDWDALGLTPLEAMSHGVPCVCSVANGGLGEILDSDEVGYFRTTHDVKELSKLTLRLLNHPQQARELGLAGRTRVTQVSQVEPIVEWYERALSGHSAASTPRRGPVPGTNAKSPSAQPSLAVLFNRIGPYHFARLRAVGKHAATTAIELFRTDHTYDWEVIEGTDGFRRMTLFEAGDPAPSSGRGLAGRVRRALDQCHPAAVALPGWSGPEAFAALQWCVESRTPAIIMSESTMWDERRVGWKEWVKARIVGMCSAALAGGEPQTEYLAALGMSRERIATGYNVVDNEYFHTRAGEARSQATEARARHGLPERYFLASMRFVEKKNLPRLIQSYSRYRTIAAQSERPCDLWDLVLLGDGHLRPELDRVISELGVSASVYLPGFKQYRELPAYYGLAGAFVHASKTEQWGLVVNEAMACGLPVLVSDRCGCAADLVQENRNGFTFDPLDVDGLAKHMLRISTLLPRQLADMGEASRKIIDFWGPDRFAKGMCDAARAALGRRPPRATSWDRLLLKALLMRSAS